MMKKEFCSDRSHAFEAMARVILDVSLSTPHTTMVSRARARDTLILLELAAYSLFVLDFVEELSVDGYVRVDLVKSFET